MSTIQNKSLFTKLFSGGPERSKANFSEVTSLHPDSWKSKIFEAEIHDPTINFRLENWFQHDIVFFRKISIIASLKIILWAL